MKVRLNRGALNDIGEILDYIAHRNPRAAAELSLQFENAAKLIGSMPEIGSKTTREHFRRLVIGNYLLVYELAGGEAIIHYVRHGARKRPWEEDLAVDPPAVSAKTSSAH